MEQIDIRLETEADGTCQVQIMAGDEKWSYVAKADAVEAVVVDARRLFDDHETGLVPRVHSPALAQLGARLAECFLAPLYAKANGPMTRPEGAVQFSSPEQDLLNLPWELLPGAADTFLVADARWSIRRTTRITLATGGLPLVAPPLRILFTACAPTDLTGLDFEKEEDAILRVVDKLGGRVHLDIAEAGSFDELKDLVIEFKPHVVHISGHGCMRNGIGHFAFEDERGRADWRDAHEMAQLLFAGRGVRLLFVSGCQTAQAGMVGICQSITANRQVPAALGWGASIGDAHATEFARSFYHELAAGRSVDDAVSAARVHLLGLCRINEGGLDLLDASFALPQLYVGEALATLVDDSLEAQPPKRRGVRYELLGDNIRGLREGFVGRRRLLQRTRPVLRAGEKHVLFLTGIGGAGKSTLATRLANRFKAEGFRIVAVQARADGQTSFGLRVVNELAAVCQRMERERDEAMLRDGERPLADRLRLGVEVLNEARILLVLDNLEAILTKPPAPPAWLEPEFAAFVDELARRLTGEGRAILTCRYVPKDLDTAALDLLHEPLPDFTEADFLKYLRRHDRVATRIERNELDGELLGIFHKKLGATPRFVEQACAILAEIHPDTLREQLEAIDEPDAGIDETQLLELRQEYFRDLFLPQLYDALPTEHSSALSRLAVTAVPLPLDGVAAVADLDEGAARAALDAWLGRALVQRFGEGDETPLYAVYPLQRDFLAGNGRLEMEVGIAAHRAAAAFLQTAFECDREEELRLSAHETLLACSYHSKRGGDAERHRWATARLAAGLYRCGEFKAALMLLEPVLKRDRHPELLKVAADAMKAMGAWTDAGTLYEEAIPVMRAIKDLPGEAATWHQIASIDLEKGNYDEAREHALKSLRIEQIIGNATGEAASWHQIASIDLRLGNYREARENFTKALKMRQACGDLNGEAVTLHQIATIDGEERKYEEARENFTKALKRLQAIGDYAGEAATWHQIATIALIEGNLKEAWENFSKALKLRHACGDLAGEAVTLGQISALAWKQHLREPAILLACVAYGILATMGAADEQKAFRNFAGMVSRVGLDEAGMKRVVQEAAEHYRKDGCAALVQAAFDGLSLG